MNILHRLIHKHWPEYKVDYEDGIQSNGKCIYCEER